MIATAARRGERTSHAVETHVRVHRAGGMRAAVAASLLDAAGRDVVAVDDSFDSAGKSGLTVRTR